MTLQEKDLESFKLHKKLEHLTIEQINTMMKRYYDGEKIEILKEDYDIKIYKSNFYSIFPPKVLGEKCKYCNSLMFLKRHSRSGYHDYKEEYSYCPICYHDNNSFCNCDKCRKIKEEKDREIESAKRELIIEEYSENMTNMIFEDTLTLEDKLYLSTLMRGGLEEELKFIKSLNGFMQQIAPTNKFIKGIINKLTDRKIIIPHINSPISSFIHDKEFPMNYYRYQVNYRINIEPYDGDYCSMIDRILHLDSEHFVKDKEFCLDMWEKIALNEVLEYLLYSMDKVGFEFNPGKKTLSVFQSLLKNYSVSQIQSIIYKCIANSTKLYQERSVTRRHAANIVISSCENYGERAIAEGWNLKGYQRSCDLPESIISQIFFNRILKIGSLGFNERPNINILESSERV